VVQRLHVHAGSLRGLLGVRLPYQRYTWQTLPRLVQHVHVWSGRLRQLQRHGRLPELLGPIDVLRGLVQRMDVQFAILRGLHRLRGVHLRDHVDGCDLHRPNCDTNRLHKLQQRRHWELVQRGHAAVRRLGYRWRRLVLLRRCYRAADGRGGRVSRGLERHGRGPVLIAWLPCTRHVSRAHTPHVPLVRIGTMPNAVWYAV